MSKTSYKRLSDKYGSLISFKYEWIGKLSVKIGLMGLLLMVLRLLLCYFGHFIFKSLTALIFITVLMNIASHILMLTGIAAYLLYWLWHIHLQVTRGIVKYIGIVFTAFLTIIAPVCIPFTYDSQVGHRIYNRDTDSDIGKDLRYLGECITASDETETYDITIDSNLAKMHYGNLYYRLDTSDSYEYHAGYVLISYDDAKGLLNELSGNEILEVSVTYNADTRIVTDYSIIENATD